MEVKLSFDEDVLLLTNNHPASSYGLPVVLYKDEVFGFDDILWKDDFCYLVGDIVSKLADEEYYKGTINVDEYKFIKKFCGDIQ